MKAPNSKWMPDEFLAAALWIGNTDYYIGLTSILGFSAYC